MRDIHCPKDIGFNNIFIGEDCKKEQLYDNCYHCWSSAIAENNQKYFKRKFEEELDFIQSHKKIPVNLTIMIHCKDCKWWKDSDGVYRRGVEAESKCPINRREVLEGNGYCYMFEPQESEE